MTAPLTATVALLEALPTLPEGIKIGPVGLPALTLGWDALAWSADYLLQPDGPNAGDPWRFTPEQARFLLWWYAIDGDGKFIYRSAVLRRMKGWGKDPFGAALSCIELLGPCRFGGWRADGSPLVVPHMGAWVQTAAVSRDQTRNTMTLLPGMISPRAIEEYGVDPGKELIYAHQGRVRLEAVTSSPRSLEGQRPSFYLENETHLWHESNDGHAMAAVIARNIAKSRDGSARVLAITNAHVPGQDSVAERDYNAHLKGTPSLLYDSLEAPADTRLDDPVSLRRGLTACRGDSEWLNIERLAEEVEDPRTLPSVSRRFYLNQLHADEDKPFSRERWDALTALAPANVVPDKALIVLGFDGSRYYDATALYGFEVATGFGFLIGLWERPDGAPDDWEVPRLEVDAALREAFRRWKVWRVYCDPPLWEGLIAEWAGRYGDKVVIEWPTNRIKPMAEALRAFLAAINGAELTHDGNPRVSAHVGNAHRRDTNFQGDDGERLWTVGKEYSRSPAKIDALVAATLAFEARRDAITAGATNEGAPRVRWL